MRISVQTVGSGLGVSLPPTIVEESQLRPGLELEVTIRDGAIVLQPIARPTCRLDELVAQITDDNMHDLVDWGPPVGGEVW